MKAMELQELKSGDYVQSVRTGEVLEVVGMDAEAGKYMLSNSKVYSTSTIKRWWNIAVVEPLVEEQDNTEEQDTTADTEEQTNTDTTATTATNIQVNELHNDTDTTAKKDVVEADTAINGAEVFTNNFGVELYTNSLSGIVIKHGCKLNRMKQYIAVRSNTVKGTLVYIRVAKEGGYHFDIGKTTWNKLDTDTQVDLVEQFDACIKDRTRGLWRISNCDSLDIFEKLLTTALDIA